MKSYIKGYNKDYSKDNIKVHFTGCNYQHL